MKIALAKDNKTGLYYRPWTSDLMTIRRVKRVYNIKDFNESDIVFDTGSHIGTFTYFIANKVKQVICFEPDIVNFKIGKYNNRNNKNVIFINEAIVANQDKKRYLYKSYSNSEGSHSLHVKSRIKSIMVSCVNYQNMIDKYKPTIIKVHLEGEEFFIYDKPVNKNVRIFIVDFHLKTKKWKNQFYEIFHNLKTKQRFKEEPKTNLTRAPRTVVVNLWRYNDR